MSEQLFKMPAKPKPPDISEAEWQKQVIGLARLCGWRIAHFRPALTKHGWRTPVSADGAGFPDLILVRDRVIAAELKSRTGKTSVEQDAWLAAFEAAGVEAHVWRPDDAPEVLETLRRRNTA